MEQLSYTNLQQWYLSYLVDFKIIPILTYQKELICKSTHQAGGSAPCSHPPINLASNSLDKYEFKIRQIRRVPLL